jgi:hypothetical protein
MGKVLVLAAGEQERFLSPAPKQIIPVTNNEPLMARTVRQVRKRMNNYPHIISHQKCLRSFSPNFVFPSSRRWICETLLSIAPVWGPDWTMTLLGDVYYTDDLMDEIYNNRDKYQFHFYGTNSEILALTFTQNAFMEEALYNVVKEAAYHGGRGKLWDLYYLLTDKPMPESGKGYTGEEDDLHYTYVIDGSIDFDTVESYKKWLRENPINQK